MEEEIDIGVLEKALEEFLGRTRQASLVSVSHDSETGSIGTSRTYCNQGTL